MFYIVILTLEFSYTNLDMVTNKVPQFLAQSIDF